MADFNKILTPGNYQDGIINVVVEIPTGSTHKIEWNRELAVMQLDRVEPKVFAKPTNYGFIPQTLDEDGDELDVLLITNDPLTTGIFLEARILGVMKLMIKLLLFRQMIEILVTHTKLWQIYQSSLLNRLNSILITIKI